MFLILFLGPPGSGKGSLAQGLRERFGFVHLSTGKIFRIMKDKSTELGSLVDDSYVNSLVLKELQRIESSDSNAKVILDGYPRTKIQAEFIANYFRIDKVFLLTNLSPEFIIKRLDNRLLCVQEDHSFNLLYRPPKVEGICDYDGSALYRRKDDSVEIVKKRLEVYESFTQPLIDHYRKEGIVVEVDSSKDLDSILNQVSKHFV